MSLLAAVEEVEEEETTPLCARITATLIASKLSSSRKRERPGASRATQTKLSYYLRAEYHCPAVGQSGFEFGPFRRLRTATEQLV